MKYLVKLLKKNTPKIILCLSITFDVFHFEISGNDINEEHPLNKLHISVTLEVFHFEMSGNDINDEHPLSILLISTTLEVFHFEISGNDINNEHPSNIWLILVALSNCEIVIFLSLLIVSKLLEVYVFCINDIDDGI